MDGLQTCFEVGNHPSCEPSALAAGSVSRMYGASTPEASDYGSHFQTRHKRREFALRSLFGLCKIGAILYGKD